MKKIQTIAYIKDGKLILKDRVKFNEAVQNIGDGEYLLSLEKVYNLRSIQQNRAKFGICYKILQACFIEATGESVSIEFIHSFCKERFLPDEYLQELKLDWQSKKDLVSETTGQVIEMPFIPTTTKMSTIQEMEYYSNMQKFCAEFFGCEIPNPNENIKDYQ